MLFSFGYSSDHFNIQTLFQITILGGQSRSFSALLFDAISQGQRQNRLTGREPSYYSNQYRQLVKSAPGGALF